MQRTQLLRNLVEPKSLQFLIKKSVAFQKFLFQFYLVVFIAIYISTCFFLRDFNIFLGCSTTVCPAYLTFQAGLIETGTGRKPCGLTRLGGEPKGEAKVPYWRERDSQGHYDCNILFPDIQLVVFFLMRVGTEFLKNAEFSLLIYTLYLAIIWFGL